MQDFNEEDMREAWDLAQDEPYGRVLRYLDGRGPTALSTIESLSALKERSIPPQQVMEELENAGLVDSKVEGQEEYMVKPFKGTYAVCAGSFDEYRRRLHLEKASNIV